MPAKTTNAPTATVTPPAPLILTREQTAARVNRSLVFALAMCALVKITRQVKDPSLN
jgi:hypothetical protein